MFLGPVVVINSVPLIWTKENFIVSLLDEQVIYDMNYLLTPGLVRHN